MSDESGGSFGETNLLVEGLLEESLTCVICECKTASDANDVLGTSSPEIFSYFTPEEAIEVAIVHLLGRVL